MLRELRVEGLAVIAAARLEPGDGFTALTGETGAGKSVCVTALRAALGGRADPGSVRPGASAARVTAVFDPVPADVRERLAELGIPDDDLLTLTREVVPGGRGSCRVNGALVSLSTLRELGDGLADVTLQGASQRLLRASWQRDLLDVAGGGAGRAPRARTEAAVHHWRDAEAALEAARRAASAGRAQVQRARDLVAELRPLELRSGEVPGLEAERVRLASAAKLAAAAEAIAEAAGEEDSGAADRLAGSAISAATMAAFDPPLAEIADTAADLVERLRELALDARRYGGTVVVDQERLAGVEERLDALARVARRHGSIEEAIAELEQAEALVAAADGGDDLVARHEADCAAVRREAAEAAAELSRLRATTARRLEREVTAQLRELALPHARFRIVLSRSLDPGGLDLGDGRAVRCAEHGADDVEFRLVTNRDMVPVALDRGPSGGELSRLALALSASVQEAGAPLLVLDEVDGGLGGETAARVGDLLAAIGAGRQVL
ncbi:MAG: AAA family ATPase, partial [Candidatus Dormibacteraeota bacterium]|nr:AAA family ATPase [Candidatus Dormibacteraeota bacterium]